MSIDLSKVPAEERDSLRAQIKADKEQAIKKRLEKTKLDEETKSKLDEYESLKAEKEKEAAEKQLKEQQEKVDAELSKEKGIANLDALKGMKAYDSYLNAKTDEEKQKILDSAKKLNPSITQANPNDSKLNVLGLSGATLENKDDEEKLKKEHPVY